MAEDSTTVQALIADILRQGNYTAVTAFNNGKAALAGIEALARQAQSAGQAIGDYVNLLITDVEMPQMDGVSLCRQIKAQFGSAIPVILFSTLHSDELETMCKACGADAYITKPQVVKLVKMIDQMTLEASTTA